MPEQYNWSSFLKSQKSDAVVRILDHLKNYFGIKWDKKSMEFNVPDLPEILNLQRRIDSLEDPVNYPHRSRQKVRMMAHRLQRTLMDLLENVRIEGTGPNKEPVTWWGYTRYTVQGKPLSIDSGWYITFEDPGITDPEYWDEFRFSAQDLSKGHWSQPTVGHWSTEEGEDEEDWA